MFVAPRLLALPLVVASALPASAQEASPRWTLFPPDDLYRPYLADPHQPGFGASLLHVRDVGVAGSGDTRVYLKLGGVFGLLRVDAFGAPWQVAIATGFDGQFDVEEGYDNLGWDGIYGLVVTTDRGAVDWKLALMHNSSHVGDELAERTGRRRLNYTREELVLGVSWEATPRWRVYGEAARGYELRNAALQEPGRLQAGVEHRAPPAWWGGRVGWYAAADVSAMEERGWNVDAALQAGLLFPSGSREWRLGVVGYDGRVPIGELSFDDEPYLGVGLWLVP